MSRKFYLALSAVLVVGSGWQDAQAQWGRGGHQGGEQSRPPVDAARHEREQELRNQEEAARRQQEQAAHQQDEARRQEREAQREQQDAQRQQQAAARAQMEQRRESQKEQEQAQRQQEQAERLQGEAQKAQMQESLREQQAAARAQMEQRRELQKEQEQAQRQQEQAERLQGEAQKAQMQENMREQRERQNEQIQTVRQQEREARHEEAIASASPNMRLPRAAWPGAIVRPRLPRPLTVASMPLQKAVSLPVLDPNWSAEEREHAQIVLNNLQNHLYAAAQAPANFNDLRQNYLNTYLSNYQTMINNQEILINRQNSFINAIPSFQYPYWYQPQNGWQFASGFTLGNMVRVGLDWLGFGWHPYYGPQPEGFICANDYIPTPWIYIPAYGLWRIAGQSGYAASGPPFDYTGPISVEVLEPRHVRVRDPYTGLTNTRVVNVMYLYNAFYNPDFERYGYMNRHGYFIWLNF